MTPEERTKLLESVRLKFESANGVEVERAQITRREMDAIVQGTRAEEREACAQVAAAMDCCFCEDRGAAAIRARP